MGVCEWDMDKKVWEVYGGTKEKYGIEGVLAQEGKYQLSAPHSALFSHMATAPKTSHFRENFFGSVFGEVVSFHRLYFFSL